MTAMTVNDRQMGAMYIIQGAPSIDRTAITGPLRRFVVDVQTIMKTIDDSAFVYDDADNMVEVNNYTHVNEMCALKTINNILSIKMRKGQTIVLNLFSTRRKMLNKILQIALQWSYKVNYVNIQAGKTLYEVMGMNARLDEPYPDDIVERIYGEVEDFKTIHGESTISVEDLIADNMVPEFDANAFQSVEIIGDIQGCYKAMRNAGLERLDPEVLYVFAGDLFDRGDENDKVFDWAVEHVDDPNVVFVLGNHDSYTRYYGRIDKVEMLPKSTAVTVNQIQKLSSTAGGNMKPMRSAATNLYHHFVKMFPFTYRGRNYVVTHGGMDARQLMKAKTTDADGRVAYAMGLESQQVFYYGAGRAIDTGDYHVDIDAIIHRENEEEARAGITPIIQFHGHRNELHVPENAYDDVFNLEDAVEHAGYLRVARIDGGNDSITVSKFQNVA